MSDSMTWTAVLTEEQRARCVRARMALHRARFGTPPSRAARPEELFGWLIGFLAYERFPPAPVYYRIAPMKELPTCLNGLVHFGELHTNKRPEAFASGPPADPRRKD